MAKEQTTAPAAGKRRATIRMYRLGVGDCFLVSFPRAGQDDFRILIDCGVHQAQTGGSQRIKDTVQDLKKTNQTARSTWWSERTSTRTIFRDFPRSRKCWVRLARVRSGRRGPKTPTMRSPKACGRERTRR